MSNTKHKFTANNNTLRVIVESDTPINRLDAIQVGHMVLQLHERLLTNPVEVTGESVDTTALVVSQLT